MKTASLLFLICCLISSCNLNINQSINPPSVIALDLPNEDYSSITWFSDNQLIFVKAPLDNSFLWNSHMIIYDLDSQQWELLEVPKADDCFSGWSLRLNTLPDGHLGFIYTCTLENNTGGTDHYDFLYRWDKQHQQFDLLHAFPEHFQAGEFSFAPDMSAFIQEEMGGAIDDALYQVRSSDQAVQLFPNFQRTASPAWSADGQTIAFFGTHIGPEPKSSRFTGSVGIGNYLFHPWDLYLLDVSTNQAEIYLSGVQLAGQMKWAPHEHLLAFRGEYKDQYGVWLFDPDTRQIRLIWLGNVLGFDWSPNGQQMVILKEIQQEETDYYYPIIVDVIDTRQ